jgi:hypothetical protein
VKEYRTLSYRILSGVVAVLLFLIGGALLRGFVVGTIMPGSRAGSAPVMTNYWGFYMMGFAGAALWAWGACLVSAVIAPAIARTVGTATAFGLVVNAIFRLIAWFSGEYAEVHNLPRIEAAIMLLLALGFIWLRPPRRPESERAAGQERSAA